MQSVIVSGGTTTDPAHPGSINHPGSIKSSMRERILAERQRRDQARREAAAHAVAMIALETPEIAAARCVAAYTSTPTAPGTLPLRRVLHSNGIRVLLPMLLDDGHLDWAVDSGTSSVSALHLAGPSAPAAARPSVAARNTASSAPTRNAPTRNAPTRNAPTRKARWDLDLLGFEGIEEADVVIIPALAVDTLGNRLGQGSGFYDSTLRLLDHSIPVFAVVYEGELLDAAIEPIPADTRERPVDAVITPHRCLRLSPTWRH